MAVSPKFYFTGLQSSPLTLSLFFLTCSRPFVKPIWNFSSPGWETSALTYCFLYLSDGVYYLSSSPFVQHCSTVRGPEPFHSHNLHSYVFASSIWHHLAKKGNNKLGQQVRGKRVANSQTRSRLGSTRTPKHGTWGSHSDFPPPPQAWPWWWPWASQPWEHMAPLQAFGVCSQEPHNSAWLQTQAVKRGVLSVMWGGLQTVSWLHSCSTFFLLCHCSPFWADTFLNSAWLYNRGGQNMAQVPDPARQAILSGPWGP